MNYSGHGHFDLAAYQKYMAGELEDHEFSQEAVTEALKGLPVVKEPTG